MAGLNKVYSDLSSSLATEAVHAERFKIKEADLELDLLTFTDKPFQGVSSVITNGLAVLKPGKGDELIFTYDPSTLHQGIDINALLVTYVQLYYLKNFQKATPGDFFHAGNIIIKGYKFVGMYTTEPVYFPENFEMKNPLVNYLWLIPVFESEFNYIQNNSPGKFERLLEDLDPDLTKLDRPPIV